MCIMASMSGVQIAVHVKGRVKRYFSVLPDTHWEPWRIKRMITARTTYKPNGASGKLSARF
jgi:hypothetical protein